MFISRRRRSTLGSSAAASNAVAVLGLMGQSNARGTPDDPSVPGGWTPDSNVMIWNGSAWVTYAPNTIAGIEFGAADANWSVELPYVKQFRIDNPSSKIGIFKFTASGTQLDASVPLTDWNTASTGEYLDQALTSYTAAMAALAGLGLTPTVRDFGWAQGENDANLSTPATNYYTNLTNLIARLRDPAKFAIPSTAGFIAWRISQVAGDAGTMAALVRNAQVQVGIDKVGGPALVVDTDGLTLSVLNGSSLHYQNTSLMEIGKRGYDGREAQRNQATADAWTPANAELTTWLARHTNVKPTLARRQAIDTFITTLKSDGTWSQFDGAELGVYDFLGARNNLVQNAYNLTPQLNPTFTPERGWKGTATNYMKTGFTPSTATTPKYAQDSAHIGVYSRSDIRSNSAGMFGNAAGTVKATINPWNGTINAMSHGLNGAATFNTFAPGAAEGFFLLSRTASTGYAVFRNGTKLGTQTSTSTGVPDQEFRVCSDALGTNIRQAFFVCWGGGLTDAQALNLSNAVITLRDAFGAQWTAVAPSVTAPTISGTRTNGSILTAASGTVGGEPTPTTTWQWTRAGVDISGATAITYTQQAADVGNIVSVRQTVTSPFDASTASATAANGAATT